MGIFLIENFDSFPKTLNIGRIQVLEVFVLGYSIHVSAINRLLYTYLSHAQKQNSYIF